MKIYLSRSMMETRALFLFLTILLVSGSRAQVSSNPDDVAFYLYPNSQNIQDKDTLTYNDFNNISSSRFDSTKDLIVLIHGFAQNYTLVFPQQVKDAYLSVGRQVTSNIVAVDWGKLATLNPAALLPWASTITLLPLNSALSVLGYPLVTPSIPIVGQRVADFLLFLLDNQLVSSLDKVHLVGMSMGCHVAGSAGALVQSKGKIGRITGLDPAGPFYQGLPTNSRLDPTDATYVDVIHTNEGEFGYAGSLGTADYYVNQGGPLQPGCELLSTNVSQIFCSHAKSISYFSASIKNTSLEGCRCLLSVVFGLICGIPPCTPFGESSPRSANGDYYLNLATAD